MKKLRDLVVPPEDPIDKCESADEWNSLENTWSVQFPTDYRRLVTLYGSGTFCESFLMILNPNSPRYGQFVETLLYQLKAARGTGIGYRVFPAVPGLYPWGMDENGGVLCWNMDGQPDHWNVVTVSAGPEYDIEEAACGAESFLVQAFTNSAKWNIWQAPFSKSELNFKCERTRN